MRQAGQVFQIAQLPCSYSVTKPCLFAAPWTLAHQAPWGSPGQNAGVSCQEIFFYLGVSNIFLQGISPDQGLNPRPLHWQVDSLSLGHLGTLRNKRLNQGTPHLHHPN